jgi:uncharacterized protein (DUF1778 family)
MPSTKPRLAITLTPESREALRRFTAATGLSASGFVTSLLHDAIPAIIATAEAIEFAKKSPVRSAQVMRDMTGKLLHEVVQAQLDLDQEVKKKRKRIRKSPA